MTTWADDFELEIKDKVKGLAATLSDGALRQASYEAARDIAERRIRMWLAEVEPRVERLYRGAAGRFVGLANEFLTSLAASGDAAFDHLTRTLAPDAGFRAPRRFYFTDLIHLTTVTPVAWLLDHFRSRSAAVRSIGRDAFVYADRLLTSNSSRVVFDLRDRLADGRSLGRRVPPDDAANLHRAPASAES